MEQIVFMDCIDEGFAQHPHQDVVLYLHMPDVRLLNVSYTYIVEIHGFTSY